MASVHDTVHMSTSPALRSRLHRVAAFVPAARGWWLVLGATLAGVLLFVLVLSDKRDESTLPGALDAAPGEPGQAYRPLPAPLPAADAAASGMDSRAAPDEAPRIDRHAGAPVPPPGMVDPSAAPADPSPTATAPDTRVPRLLSASPPDYPRSALRAGLSGRVTLRIEVRANGRPGEVSVVESSGHRALDRAAISAVRRWRFEPAMHEGAPVASSVQQVISFDAPR